jgi:hypothetical protein
MTVALAVPPYTFSIRPPPLALDVVQFYPGPPAPKQTRPHHGKREPKVDSSPHPPQTHIDDIFPEEFDVTGLQPSRKSPKRRFPPATVKAAEDLIHLDALRSGKLSTLLDNIPPLTTKNL